MDDTVYLIKSPSTCNPLAECLLGHGADEPAAWVDAFGPKPWTASTKRAARRAFVRTVPAGEADELIYG
jgi:hypothetical protein